MSRVRALVILTELGFKRTMQDSLTCDPQGRFINEWRFRREYDTFTVHLIFDNHEFQYWSIVDDESQALLFQANRAERLIEKITGLNQCELDQ